MPALLPRSLALFTLLLFSTPVALASDEGIPLTIQVVDADGDPVVGAAVRNTEEGERHRVNVRTGTWTSRALYPSANDVIPFTRGMDVTFEITAPGYLSETVHYVMRRRRNVIEVTLSPMELDDSEAQGADPNIAFGRDVPREEHTTQNPAQ